MSEFWSNGREIKDKTATNLYSIYRRRDELEAFNVEDFIEATKDRIDALDADIRKGLSEPSEWVLLEAIEKYEMLLKLTKKRLSGVLYMKFLNIFKKLKKMKNYKLIYTDAVSYNGDETKFGEYYV